MKYHSQLHINRRLGTNHRGGISLLEVILAIGILGASIAALSSVVMNGAAAATDAKNRSMAQLLCEQQMAQLLINNIMPRRQIRVDRWRLLNRRSAC